MASSADNRDRDLNLKRRRSTRVAQAAPITIRGMDASGQPFQEHTSTVSINCYGCRFQSKHNISKNTWIVLEIPHRMSGQPPRVARAKVTWCTPPRSGHERFQVGVELEQPGNIWGMAFPPEDWFPFPESAEGAQSSDNPLRELLKTKLEIVERSSASPAAGTTAESLLAPDTQSSKNPSGGEDTYGIARQIAVMVADAKQQIEAAARRPASSQLESGIEALQPQIREAALNAVREALVATKEDLRREVQSRLEEFHKASGIALRERLGREAEFVMLESGKQLTSHLAQLVDTQKKNLEQRMQSEPLLSEELLRPALERAAMAAESAMEQSARAAAEQIEKQANAFRESLERSSAEAENSIGAVCSSLDAEMNKARLLLDELRGQASSIEDAGNRLDALRRSSDEELKWQEKRIEDHASLVVEKGIEQATKSLSEKAAEVTSRFTAQLDHYSRSYIEHTQLQLEEASRVAAARTEAGPDSQVTTEASVEAFKARLDEVANNWVATTVNILDERAQEVLANLIKNAESRFRDPSA